MLLRRRLAAFVAVIASVMAVGAPVALASSTPRAPGDPVVTGPSCPDGYNGPTNLATGCPYWLMSYTVQYPGESPLRCPVNWNRSPASQGVGADPGSAGRAVHGCGAVATVT
jgi:hypothetical protein